MARVSNELAAAAEELKLEGEKYRALLGAVALNTQEPIYDRLAVLFEAQKPQDPGLPSVVTSIPVIKHLERAAIRRPPILAATTSGLAVGYLEANDPWSIIDVEQMSGGKRRHDLALVANFAGVRVIDYMVTHYGVGYGGGGTVREAGAEAVLPDENTLIVALDPTPVGYEGFTTRLETVEKNVVIGWEAIHRRIEDMQLAPPKGVDLHTAVTMAASNLQR